MAGPQRSTTSFAKTTRPETGAVVPRAELHALLDGTPARRIAWIWGAPGSGKSTLAASYVDAREARCAWYQIDPDDEDVASFFHYLGLAARRIGVEPDALPTYGTHANDPGAFSRQFFRTLFAGAAPASVLVLDNLHALPQASALHAVLEAGLSQVPRHCLVIVTSRAEPVGGWSRMRASGELVCLGGDALRITTDELVGIAALRGIPLSRAALAAMQVRAQGWAAALVLMLEHARIAGRLAEPPRDATPPVVFDYLAGEIFDRFEPATRRFLLRIACLPRMTADVAQALSGEAMAGRLLRNFVHNDYFVREVVEGTSHVFALHPLMRSFLLARAADALPEAVGADARKRGAKLLYAAGQIEDAVQLQIEGQDWAGVAASVAEQSGTLLSQGRHATVATWIEALPAQVLAGDESLLCLARTLIRNGRLFPDAAGAGAPPWPWRFRIQTFGGFVLEREGTAVAFSAKGPGRPVELLKVLVALGGAQIRVEQVMDALWPNVDADYAYGSFTATLHRLRRILGDDEVVVLRDGRVSLDRSLAWLDTWALDDLIVRLEAGLRTPEASVAASTARAFIDEALALYRGAFLDDAEDQVAYLAKREQVRTRLGRHLSRLARVLEDGGDAQAAIDCHFRSIDADESYEAFHRNLMACQLRLGDRAGALAAYERLRTLLVARGKPEPSGEAEGLYVTLRP